jgi:hypothetical protein
VPAIYPLRELASAGSVISDGASISDAYRHCGVYAGRIGEKPADLPVLQSTKFDFVINLYLSARSPKTDVPMLAAFRRGLSESGYVVNDREARNVAVPPSDELAAPHSITSSARPSSIGGISRPSAFAVLRLITNSNFVGRITGRSPGFSPLRIRPA